MGRTESKTKTVTTIEYCRMTDGSKSKGRSRKNFKTDSVSCAMRRFFAERGDDTELMPTRVWQNKYSS